MALWCRCPQVHRPGRLEICRQKKRIANGLYQITSCLGTKRGLMQRDRALPRESSLTSVTPLNAAVYGVFADVLEAKERIDG
jgi:hypothetical protein